MALTDSQISGLLEEIVDQMRPAKDRGEDGDNTAKKLVAHLEKWNGILHGSRGMQLLGMTLVATYAELDKHKDPTYVVDKTLQMGMLVGYLLRQKEQEVEQLEALHGKSSN